MWSWYVVSTLAMVYTHNWAWLVLAGEWFAVALIVAIDRTRERKLVTREWLSVQLIIGLAYLPWIQSLLYQVRHAGHAPLSVDGWLEMVAVVVVSASAFLQTTVLGFSAGDNASLGAVVQSSVVILVVIVLSLRILVRSRRERSRSPTGGAANSARATMLILVVTPVAAWGIALALSTGSNLLLARCVAMLAPPLLIALASWISLPQLRSRRLISRLALAGLIVTYLLSSYSILRTTRSNARDVAAAVAKETRRTDLVIVAPEWLASSFNRYFSSSVEQVDYPHFGREGAVDFARLRERTVDPAAFVRMQQMISEARRAGRRVWLVTDEEGIVALTPTETREGLASSKFGIVGLVRAKQIQTELATAYGAPATSLRVSARPTQIERLTAYLFSPE
jgi:hypothetical protein